MPKKSEYKHPKAVNDSLSLSVELMQYCMDHDLIDALRFLCYFKIYTPGGFKRSTQVFQRLGEFFKHKDRRTVKKYFDECVKLGWLQLHPSDKYSVVSFNEILASYNLESRVRFKFYSKDLTTCEEFVFASIVSKRIRDHKRYWRLSKEKRNNTARLLLVRATQCYTPSNKAPKYFGIGLASLADTFHCGITKVHELKKLAVKAGYLKVNPKFDVLKEFTRKQPNALQKAKLANPEISNTLRVRRMGDRIQIVRQLHDEIISLLPVKTGLK